MTKKERKFVRIFAKIADGSRGISYHRESWDGPKVIPTRFYPSRLVKLVKERETGDITSASSGYIPDPFELRLKAPVDEKINAYIIGDSTYYCIRSVSNITQPSPGPDYVRGMSQGKENFGHDSVVRLVCVNYCSLSQRDLNKKKPGEK